MADIQDDRPPHGRPPHDRSWAPLRDVIQLMGAILFVLALLTLGWHAAHVSGVWVSGGRLG
ncbi:hypothetical protein [Nguyenibacter sp. L1]|uniref:hypothetical protein n=1 Tax=Nguyenibacter sp. L1 TaxID=3049350 RepID=UPI002B47691B|nr:hypothetical protein [Nguyenibacter sp. L1]WRH88437.1 hypothetical protein QN315_02030 [Nguyenibacter sp. L1]